MAGTNDGRVAAVTGAAHRLGALHTRRHLTAAGSQWLVADADTRLVGAGGAANKIRNVQ